MPAGIATPTLLRDGRRLATAATTTTTNAPAAADGAAPAAALLAAMARLLSNPNTRPLRMNPTTELHRPGPVGCPEGGRLMFTKVGSLLGRGRKVRFLDDEMKGRAGS